MAQSRAKRNRRSHRRPPTGVPSTAPRRTRTKRAVIAFLVLVGIAGILAVSAPGDDGTGAPDPAEMSTERGR